MKKQNQASLERGIMAEEGITKLTVNHNGKDLTFLHPAYGPDDYTPVGEQIEQDGLLRPTMAETTSLVYAAFDSAGKYSDEIKRLMRNRLWGFTGTLYVPKKGAYIQDNPEIREGMPYMDEKDLEGKLKKGDKTVRFVPFGYKVGKMSALKLEKNPYVIALAGEEGAEKLAEVADKYIDKPYLWSFESVNKLLTRVSDVSPYWSLDDRRLDVNDYNYGDGRLGFGLGVQKKTGKKD